MGHTDSTHPCTLHTHSEHSQISWSSFLFSVQDSGHVLLLASRLHVVQNNRIPEFFSKLPVHELSVFKGEDEFCVLESKEILFTRAMENHRQRQQLVCPMSEHWLVTSILLPALTVLTLSILQDIQCTAVAEVLRGIVGLLVTQIS